MARNKKLLLSGLCVALFAVLGIFGTVAYFTDTDDDVNVMTVGNVQIDQIEQQRGENGLEPFEQGQNIDPVYGNTNDKVPETINGYEIGNFRNLETIENYTDKIVTVENTGKNPAYVRTLIAFPTAGYNSGEQAYAEWLHWNGVSDTDTAKNNGWMWGRDRSEWPGNTDNWDKVEDVMINGVEYDIYVATNKNVIEPGEATAPSLLGFYLDASLNYDEGGYYFEPNGVKTYIGDISDLNILVATQACQTDLGETAWDALDVAFGDVNEANVKAWLGGDELTVADPIKVNSAEELQDALDDAVDGDTIVLMNDITGDLDVAQAADTDVTILGNGNDFSGVLTVDGKSATYKTAGLTIKNVNFKADSISADACIRLGDGTNATRYTCNVTIENCTFDVPGAVGIKSYTGGDKNLKVINCTALAGTHSLIQAKGIDGILIDGCEVYSKNGMNFNNSDNVTVIDTIADVTGYAVRFGESSGGAGYAETYLIKDCNLKSACDDGDAVIILRGTADNSTLTIVNTILTGAIEITNTAAGATVVK